MSQGLFVDTASFEGVALIFSEDKIAASFVFPSNTELFSTLSKAFLLAQMVPSDLDFIAAGVGPGSFTGVRNAQMAARSLAYALKIPLYGLSSLSLYGEEGPLLMDARSGGVWAQVPKSPPELISPEKLGEFVKDYSVLYSPHPEKLEAKLKVQGFLGRLEKAAFDLEGIKAEVLKERSREGASYPDILYLR